MPRRHIAVTLFSLLLGPVLGLRASTEVSISLDQAVKQRKVEVEITSLGGATGNVVRVAVRRRVPEKLNIQLVPGTVFLAKSNDVQNLAARCIKGKFTERGKYRATSVIVLADSGKHSYLVEAFCLDFGKRAPQRSHTFSLAAVDQRAKRILDAGEREEAPLRAVQSALWKDRAGVSDDDLRQRFSTALTELEVRVTRRLLDAAEQMGIAEIPPGMASEVRVEVVKLFSSNPDVRAEGVDNLRQLGARALAAIPFIAANVLRTTADNQLPSTVVDVDVSPEHTTVAIEQLGFGRLAALIGQHKARDGGNPNASSGTTEASIKDRLFERRIENLKRGNVRSRQRAVRVLGMTKDPRAVAPLIAVLEDEDASLREAAAESLRQITGEDFGTEHDKWNDWHQKNKEPHSETP